MRILKVVAGNSVRFVEFIKQLESPFHAKTIRILIWRKCVSVHLRCFSSQTNAATTGLSYYHKAGNQTLVYRTLGQQLKISADKYADREALISYHEQKAISFAEALDKVLEILSLLFYVLSHCLCFIYRRTI